MKKLLSRINAWLDKKSGWFESLVDEEISNRAAILIVICSLSLLSTFALAQFSGTAGWQVATILNAIYTFILFRKDVNDTMF